MSCNCATDFSDPVTKAFLVSVPPLCPKNKEKWLFSCKKKGQIQLTEVFFNLTLGQNKNKTWFFNVNVNLFNY